MGDSVKFLKALKVFILAESLGGYESLAELPYVLYKLSSILYYASAQQLSNIRIFVPQIGDDARFDPGGRARQARHQRPADSAVRWIGDREGSHCRFGSGPQKQRVMRYFSN